jgi:hypothetical protein
MNRTTNCPTWCVDHDDPDPLGLPTLHFGTPVTAAKDGPYLFQEGDNAPLVGLYNEHLSVQAADRLSVLLAACVAAADPAGNTTTPTLTATRARLLEVAATEPAGSYLRVVLHAAVGAQR